MKVMGKTRKLQNKSKCAKTTNITFGNNVLVGIGANVFECYGGQTKKNALNNEYESN